MSLLDSLNPCFNDETEIDGAVCHSITAEFPRGGERELWIEKTHAFAAKGDFASGETARSEEVRENICVNEVLERKLFAA